MAYIYVLAAIQTLMDKLNLNINDLLRFVFAGGWGVLCFLFINPESSKILANKDLLGFADYLFISLIFGSLIYSTHRAIINPNLYKLTYWIAHKIKKLKTENINPIPFLTTKVEISDAIFRWKKEVDDKSIIKRLSEWASQVHFLYCSALSGIVSIIISTPLGDPHSDRKCYVWWAVTFLFLSAFISHVRYCLHYLSVKEDNH